MRIRLLGLVLVLCVVTTCLTALRADEPTLTRLPLPDDFAEKEAWYGIYIAGKKSGWAHETLRRVGSGRAAMWVARLDAEIQMKVAGQVSQTALGEMTVFDGSPPYRFRRGVTLYDDGVALKRIRVRSDAQALWAQITEVGETRKRDGRPIDFTFEDHCTSFNWVREPRAVGDTIHVQSVSLDDVEGEVTTYVVEGKSTESHGGVPVAVYDVSMSSDRDGEAGEIRIDSAGNVLRMKMGAIFELRREPEEVARQMGEVGDVFLEGTVKIDVPIGNPTKVTGLVVAVVGEEASQLADAPRQKVVVEDGTVLLHLGDVHPDGFPAAPAEIEESLEEETEYPIYNARVVALAQRAIGDAKTDREKVARLVPFVGEYVKDANVARGLTVIELLRNPEGDCSEHSLLFTALARAVGVPSRQVSGLMYMGDKAQAFGAHAWSEVVLDGKWVAVDPAWNQLELDATHVTLSRTDRDQMRMMRLFGQISFELKKAEGRP